MRRARTFRASEGATAVEYALLLLLIALVIIGGVQLLGEATGERLCSPTERLAEAGVESIDGECP